MHVMSKYLDTYKATVAAIEDCPVMQNIIDTTDQEIKEAYERLASLPSPRFDGMPRASNPEAGQERIAAALDKVDAYRERYAQAREYMDWFLSGWNVLSEDDQFVLDTFYFAADDISQEERIRAIAEHFYIERSSVHTRKSRAVGRLAKALYG